MNELTLSLTELFQKAKSGEVQMHSSLGSRDESKQTKQFTTRIQKMKTICGLNTRMLVMKDIVLPFNPFTGVSDSVYNEKHPFRPILLVSQVIQQLKIICASNKELKAKYEKILGGSFSDGEEVSYSDYKLFKDKGFIKPRITTYYVVSVDLNGRNGFPEFKVNYTIDYTQLNSEGTYDIGQAPIHHSLAVLFNSICREEWKEQESLLKNSNATDDELTAARRNIFSKAPISFVKPKNLIPFFFFDINQDFPEISEENYTDVEKYLRYYSYTDKWQLAFDEANKDDTYDELIDYYDFTVKTPSSGSKSSKGTVYTDEDPNTIYQAMSINITDARKSIASGELNGKKYSSLFAPVNSVIYKYFEHSQEEEFKEDGKGFEQIMALSNRFRPIESVSDKLATAANEVFVEKFAGSPYFTESIRKANSDILTAMNPANILATAGYDDDELQEAAQEQNKTLTQMIAEASDNEDSIDLSEIPVENLDIDISTPQI